MKESAAERRWQKSLKIYATEMPRKPHETKATSILMVDYNSCHIQIKTWEGRSHNMDENKPRKISWKKSVRWRLITIISILTILRDFPKTTSIFFPISLN